MHRSSLTTGNLLSMNRGPLEGRNGFDTCAFQAQQDDRQISPSVEKTNLPMILQPSPLIRLH